MPLGMTIMTRAAGPRRMGRLMAILGVPMLLGPILGPIIGGWLIENASWNWIFLINVPIGLIAAVYAFVVLPQDAPHPSESLDVLGVVLMSPGLALFLYGISSIPGEHTVNAPKVYVPAAIGAVLIGLFVRHTFRPQHPLLDLRLFRNRNLTVAVTTMFLFGPRSSAGCCWCPRISGRFGASPPGTPGFSLRRKGSEPCSRCRSRARSRTGCRWGGSCRSASRLPPPIVIH